MYHLRSWCELEFSFIHLLLVLSCSILNHFLTKISLSLISSNLLFCRCGPTATWEGLHLLWITGSFQSPIERSWGRNLRQEHGGRNKSRNNGGHCLLACSWASSQVFLPPRPTVWGWPLPEKDRFCYINKQYFFLNASTEKPMDHSSGSNSLNVIASPRVCVMLTTSINRDKNLKVTKEIRLVRIKKETLTF